MAGQQVAVSILKEAFKKIPWKKILAIIGPIVYEPLKDKFGELIGRIGKSDPIKDTLPLEEYEKRMKDLEQATIEIGQNKIPDIEHKLQFIAEGLLTLSARVTILVYVASAALVVSVAALIVAWKN